MAARILIIEDNSTNLELVRYLLEHAGHATVAASDGSAGLAVLQTMRPDLIITDLRMPIADGYEVLRRIRMNPLHDNVPVVAITAFSMAGDHEAVLASGFSGYISKPIEPERFVSTIESFLPPDLRASSTNSRS